MYQRITTGPRGSTQQAASSRNTIDLHSECARVTSRPRYIIHTKIFAVLRNLCGQLDTSMFLVSTTIRNCPSPKCSSDATLVCRDVDNFRKPVTSRKTDSALTSYKIHTYRLVLLLLTAFAIDWALCVHVQLTFCPLHTTRFLQRHVYK
jgi:hypothetical protein